MGWGVGFGLEFRAWGRARVRGRDGLRVRVRVGVRARVSRLRGLLRSPRGCVMPG